VGLRLSAGAGGDARRHGDLHGGRWLGRRHQRGRGRREGTKADLHEVGEDVRHARRENNARSAAMLHSEFLISPTWRANCQGVRPAQIRKGATQAVVGGLMGGSGPKSVSGSSLMNSELGEYGKDTRGFRLVQASGE
jgi:hypothetical protein